MLLLLQLFSISSSASERTNQKNEIYSSKNERTVSHGMKVQIRNESSISVDRSEIQFHFSNTILHLLNLRLKSVVVGGPSMFSNACSSLLDSIATESSDIETEFYIRNCWLWIYSVILQRTLSHYQREPHDCDRVSSSS